MKTISGNTSRSQSERRKHTRNVLLDATIAVLLKSGFEGCSLAKVAKEAGLTTGSVQHHFSTKSQLMLAVVEQKIFTGSEDDSTVLATVSQTSIAERCEQLVAWQWRFYGNPVYPAFWAIILGGRSDPDMMEQLSIWQQKAVFRHERLIKAVFSDAKLKPSEVQSIQYFINAHLRGLALLQTIEPAPKTVGKQLKMLATMLDDHLNATR